MLIGPPNLRSSRLSVLSGSNSLALTDALKRYLAFASSVEVVTLAVKLLSPARELRVQVMFVSYSHSASSLCTSTKTTPSGNCSVSIKSFAAPDPLLLTVAIKWMSPSWYLPLSPLSLTARLTRSLSHASPIPLSLASNWSALATIGQLSARSPIPSLSVSLVLGSVPRSLTSSPSSMPSLSVSAFSGSVKCRFTSVPSTSPSLSESALFICVPRANSSESLRPSVSVSGFWGLLSRLYSSALVNPSLSVSMLALSMRGSRL